jgi:hypothetical protein
VAKHASRVLVSLYDVAIVLPLLAERAPAHAGEAVPALDIEEARRAS